MKTFLRRQAGMLPTGSGYVPPPPPPSYRRRSLLRRVGVDRLTALALLVALIAVRLIDPAPVELLRLRTFDALQAWNPRPTTIRPVVIVDIDEDSLRSEGQWPWARTRIADLVTRLSKAGATAIVFDMVFPEPDRLSPDRIARSIRPMDASMADRLEALPSTDAVLADAMRSARVILGQTALAQPTTSDGGLPRTGFAVLGPDPSAFLSEFPGLLHNLPLLEHAAAGRGMFTIVPERDGLVRRLPLVMLAEGRMVPAVTLETLRVLTGAGAILVRTDAGGIRSVALPGLEVPTDAYGSIWLHFNAHDPARFISARTVLDGSFDPDRVARKIVMIGTSALGLLDNKTSPIDRSIPGVEVQAQMMEIMLGQAALAYPSYAVLLEVGLTLVVGFGIIVLAPVLGALRLLVLGGLVAVLLVGVTWIRFTQQNTLQDSTFPLLASLSVYATLIFSNYAREQMGRQRIRSAFSQYLSPALVEQLAAHPETLKLGGEERTLTIMFSDVRGFTTIAEFYKTDPAGLTALMNRFLSPLTDAILESRGTIDKYMGDAIMAFWNAPLDDGDQEAHACAAALAMIARMDALNALRKVEAESGGHPVLPIDIGIGINTGRCVVGNMGSHLRFDYSVLGDPVNLASRLEGQSKSYAVKTILGPATAAAVGDRYALLEIDLIQVKGKAEAERISTLVGDASLLASDAFQTLREAHMDFLEAYRACAWSVARAHLALCRARQAEINGVRLGGLYDLYETRIAAYEVAPPPADWGGIYVALDK